MKLNIKVSEEWQNKLYALWQYEKKNGISEHKTLESWLESQIEYNFLQKKVREAEQVINEQNK